MPRLPVRTISIGLPGCGCGLLNRARDLVGADGEGGRIARDEERASCARLLQQRVEPRRGQPADGTAVDHRRWRRGAETQAVDRLERDVAVAVVCPQRDTQLLLRASHQRLAAHRLARFGATQLDHVTAGGSCRKSW